MISRLSGWLVRSSAKRAAIDCGKYELSARANHGSSGQPGRFELLGQGDLDVGGEHGQLGRDEAEAGRVELGHLLVRGQELERAVQVPGTLQVTDEAPVHRHHRCGQAPFQPEQDVLLVVVGEDVLGHLVRRRGQQRVAVGRRQAAWPATCRLRQGDLDVDLVVRGVHAGRVVDGVGVDPAARSRVFDPAQLGDAQVAALADDPGGEVRPPSTRTASLALSPTWALVSAAALT